MKILILASNPRKDLNLDREIRDLKEVIKKSRNRRELEVEDALAVRVGELQDLLFRYRPQIVHFCGHGSGQQGLVFEGNDGGEQWVRAEALSDLFRLFAENVGCVLLNACYSEEQANAIVNHIDYVIGMNQEIRDDAAISFSKGFYRALGYECSIEQAYEFGKNAIQLEISGSSKMRSAATEEIRKAEVVEAIQQTIIPEHLKPILKIKPTLALGDKANVIAPEQPLSHATRTAIHLEIENALEADVTKQYRDRVREYLIDHKLTDFEKIRLEQLRKNLRLSVEEAQQILEEEEEPLQKARDEYEEMLIRLIEEGFYPFSTETETNLQELRQELQLTDLEVENVAQPVLQAAEKDYQERLRQQKKEYEDKLQCYKQEFSKALQVEYPPSRHVADGLRGFWQQLGLKEEDVIQIEQPIRALLEAKYQEQLKQRELAEKQRQAELELKRQKAEYESKLRRYEQEFSRAVQAEYPLSQHVADGLKSFQQQLELKETDVRRIEQPIREPLEAKYQGHLRQQELAEQQRQLEIEQNRRKAEYENKLRRYEQEFSKALQANYPLSDEVCATLKRYQQILELSQADIDRLEKPLITKKQTEYRQTQQLSVPSARDGVSSIAAIQLDANGFSAAILNHCKASVIPNQQGELKTPAIIAYTSNGEWLVGQKAKDQAASNSANTFDESLLNLLGCRYRDVVEEIRFLTYRVSEDDNGFLKIHCPHLNQTLKPEEILARGLRILAEDIHRHLGRKIELAVVSVPSCFTLLQRNAVKSAAQLAGLECLRVVQSSTLAGVAFGINIEENATILVVDVSKGHVVTSILEVENGVFEVLGVYGKSFINENQEGVLYLLQTALEEVLRCSKLTKDKVDKVFLSGSSLYLSAIDKKIQQIMSQQRIKAGFSEMAVVLGGSVQTAVLAGAVKDILVLDVISSGFEVKTADGQTAWMIPWNTTIPTLRSEYFTTIFDNQTSVEIPIIQTLRASNQTVYLGSVRLNGISSAPAGIPKIEVKFAIDANESLCITAIDKASRQRVSVTATELYQDKSQTSTIRKWQEQQENPSSYNLEIPLVLKLEEMSQGVQKEIKLQDGKKITVKIPAGVKAGQKIRIRGKGKLNATTQTYGDLFLIIS